MKIFCALRPIAIAVLSGSFVAGCIMGSAPKPPKSWMVSATRKSAAEVSVTKASRLGSLSVVAPYDRPALAVKRADGSIAFDAYNVFATAPAALLRAPLTVLLEDDGRFGRIIPSTSAARANATVEAVVTDISLDCRKEGVRTAHVSITLAVMENREVKMFLDGEGSADAASGDYSAAFSTAFGEAVADALRSYPVEQGAQQQ